MAKLYGPARAVKGIGSLQIETSSYPAISAVDKTTLISKINTTDSVRDKLVAGENLTDAEFVIAENANNTWNGSVSINFGSITVKSVVTSVSLSDAVAFLESWGGTVITPVTRSLSSVVTLTNVTYGTATKQVEKLYGLADALGNPPLKGNTTQSASPTPSSPQAVNTATGEQRIRLNGKNLSPIITGYNVGTNGGASYTKSNGTIIINTGSTGTATNKGIYVNKSVNENYCPEAYMTGYTVSFTVVASAESYFAYRNEGQAYNYATIGTTPMRLSFPSGTRNMIFYAQEQNITFTLSDFQVETGSTATAFSPYAQLYDINLGKNLFDPAQTPIYLNGPTSVSQITNGLRIISNRTTTSTTSHYDIAFFAIGRADEYIGKALTLSVGTVTPSTSGNQRMTIVTCDADGSNRTVKASTTETSNAKTTYTPTSDDKGKYIAVGLYAMNGVVGSPAGSYVDYENIQLEVGSTSTTYAPYFTPIELCKIDTYQDYIHKVGDDWYIHKAVGEVTINVAVAAVINSSGSSSRTEPSYAGAFMIQKANWDAAGGDYDNTIARARLSSNVGIYQQQQVSANNSANEMTDGTFCQRSGTNDRIYFRNTGLTGKTGDEVRALLLDNGGGSNFYYLLATPTETQITDSTLISQLNALWSAATYGDDTNLTVTGEIPMIGTDVFRSTRRIRKFYGSVNNKTKLIYEE